MALHILATRRRLAAISSGVRYIFSNSSKEWPIGLM
jgi:hypothetical protein